MALLFLLGEEGRRVENRKRPVTEMCACVCVCVCACVWWQEQEPLPLQRALAASNSKQQQPPPDSAQPPPFRLPRNLKPARRADQEHRDAPPVHAHAHDSEREAGGRSARMAREEARELEESFEISCAPTTHAEQVRWSRSRSRSAVSVVDFASVSVSGVSSVSVCVSCLFCFLFSLSRSRCTRSAARKRSVQLISAHAHHISHKAITPSSPCTTTISLTLPASISSDLDHTYMDHTYMLWSRPGHWPPAFFPAQHSLGVFRL
eukprot:3933450-Rhodomonas_salina.2